MRRGRYSPPQFCYTPRAGMCTVINVERLNVTLDDAYAAKLSRLADRMHVQAGTLARSLLQTAIDGAEPDAATMVELLNGIDGALESARAGSQAARAGEFVDFADL